MREFVVPAPPPTLKFPKDWDGKFYALFSGGKDSTTAAHVLAEAGRLKGLLHIDTTIQTPDIQPHLKAVSERFGWPLKVVRTPVDYETMVLRWGFPSYDTHQRAVNILKGRAMRLFRKENPDAVCATGIRRFESNRRRMMGLQPWSDFEGVPVFAPILDWTTDRVWAYVKEQKLTRSPAYDTLHISGDCMCGSFAEPEEIHLVRMFYPELAKRLQRLEERVKDEGVIRNRIGCRWGGGPGATGAAAQRKLDEAYPSPACADCSIGGPAMVAATEAAPSSPRKGRSSPPAGKGGRGRAVAPRKGTRG